MAVVTRRVYRQEFGLPPSERALYGCTVTAVNLDNGERLTLARTKMTAVQALKEIIAELDALDGYWRVVTVSNPTTIARDLHASRIALDGQNAGSVGTGHLPEFALLKRIGRPEMVHVGPRARPTFDGPSVREFVDGFETDGDTLGAWLS